MAGSPVVGLVEGSLDHLLWTWGRITKKGSLESTIARVWTLGVKAGSPVLQFLWTLKQGLLLHLKHKGLYGPD